MSKKANPAVIGSFVIVALMLTIAAILILGSGKLFAETEQFVLYFEESISGLDIGAPVEYGGVRVGSVTDTRLEYNTNNGAILIPVYIELEPKRLQYTGTKDAANYLQQSVRAQLQSQSVLTGKLKIMLINSPDTPARLTGGDPHTPELPTMPSLFEHLGKSLNELPLVEIMDHLNKTVRTLAEILNSGEIQIILQELRQTSEGLSEITASGELQGTLKSLRTTVDSGQKLVEKLDRTIDPIQRELGPALREFSDTAQSARHLIDYLERHPESLIRGKGKE